MKTKGFTLVELLVVIAILAILATVSVVGYTTYINNANDSVAVQELTQIRDYAIAYDLTSGGNKDGKVSATEFEAAVGAIGGYTYADDFVVTSDANGFVEKVVFTHSNTGKATWTVSGNKVVAGAQ